jgi:putative SOS response-associated peptidase YedK
MPVILRTVEECDAWLTAEQEEALEMQRPLPGDALKIVARGEKEDPPSNAAPRIETPAVVPELPL